MGIMKYILDDKDRRIFNEFYLNPFQTYNGIGKIVKLAPATVKLRIMNMKEHGFLRKDQQIDDILGKRIRSEVIASYSPSSIGLIRMHVLFDRIPNVQSLDKLVAYCDEHPYTHYRGHIFKNSVNLYAQFDVPIDTLDLMRKTLNEVGSYLGVENVKFVSCSNNFYSYPDFEKIDIGSSWNNQNEDTDDYYINYMWNEFQSNKKPYNNGVTIKKYTMSNIDAKLLRELSINAKVPLQFLSDTYNLSKSVISRYLTKLKQNVIQRGVLLYDESFFGLNNLQVIFGKFSNHSKLNGKELIQFFESYKLPLLSNFYYDQDNFVLQTIASPLISTEIAKFLWQNTVPTELNVNQLHVPNTLLYYFYHENYIDRNTWNTDEDYIKHNPFNVII